MSLSGCLGCEVMPVPGQRVEGGFCPFSGFGSSLLCYTLTYLLPEFPADSAGCWPPRVLVFLRVRPSADRHNNNAEQGGLALLESVAVFVSVCFRAASLYLIFSFRSSPSNPRTTHKDHVVHRPHCCPPAPAGQPRAGAQAGCGQRVGWWYVARRCCVPRECARPSLLSVSRATHALFVGSFVPPFDCCVVADVLRRHHPRRGRPHE